MGLTNKALIAICMLLCLAAGMLLMFGLFNLKPTETKAETEASVKLTQMSPVDVPEPAAEPTPEPAAPAEPENEPVPADPYDIDCYEFAEAVKAALPNQKLRIEEVYDYKANLSYGSGNFSVEEYLSIVELVKALGFTEENGFTVIDSTNVVAFRVYHAELRDSDEQTAVLICDVSMNPGAGTVRIDLDKYDRGEAVQGRTLWGVTG